MSVAVQAAASLSDSAGSSKRSERRKRAADQEAGSALDHAEADRTSHRRQSRRIHIAPSHPFGVKPAGNALVETASERRAASLGNLAHLPHDLLLAILGQLDPQDLARLEQVNHSARAFARHEPLWRDLFLAAFKGRMASWRGCWKDTVAAACAGPSSSQNPQRAQIKARTVFSDELYLPLQLASTPLEAYAICEGGSGAPYRKIDRLDPKVSSKQDFLCKFAAPNKPCLIIEDSSAREELPRWKLADMHRLLGKRRVRAEALTTTMETYCAYAQSCSTGQASRSQWTPDESPFYLFDPNLARWLQRQNLFVVPRLLREDVGDNKGVLAKDCDLFSLLQDQRPDNMWVIAGPERSGSGWHVDPNHTSAYNTVLSGSKLWLMLPPYITPPGVLISSDGSSVTAPWSISEWIRDFMKPCVRQHGRRGDNTLQVDICGPGETIYVPAGWKHLVVNLEESVAFTQNFVSPAELPAVLDFLKNRPEQISGFRVQRKGSVETSTSDDESEPELDTLEHDGITEKRKLFALFASRLKEFDGDLFKRGIDGINKLEERRRHALGGFEEAAERKSWWQSLKDQDKAQDELREGANLGLFASRDQEDDELGEVPW